MAECTFHRLVEVKEKTPPRTNTELAEVPAPGSSRVIGKRGLKTKVVVCLFCFCFFGFVFLQKRKAP